RRPGRRASHHRLRQGRYIRLRQPQAASRPPRRVRARPRDDRRQRRPARTPARALAARPPPSDRRTYAPADMTLEELDRWLDVYGRAWENKDVDGFVDCF